MVKRTYTNNYNEEPNQTTFKLPAEGEHLFQVVDVYSKDYTVGKLVLDENTVSVKCEIVGGDDAGNTLLNRLTLDESGRGFFATRLFLKAIDESYKGDGLNIDTDRWIGKQFYANVIHNGKYANIETYNFDKVIANQNPGGSKAIHTDAPIEPKDISWEN